MGICQGTDKKEIVDVKEKYLNQITYKVCAVKELKCKNDIDIAFNVQIVDI